MLEVDVEVEAEAEDDDDELEEDVAVESLADLVRLEGDLGTVREGLEATLDVVLVFFTLKELRTTGRPVCEGEIIKKTIREFQVNKMKKTIKKRYVQ
jgi:hypothetical protein